MYPLTFAEGARFGQAMRDQTIMKSDHRQPPGTGSLFCPARHETDGHPLSAMC